MFRPKRSVDLTVMRYSNNNSNNNNNNNNNNDNNGTLFLVQCIGIPMEIDRTSFCTKRSYNYETDFIYDLTETDKLNLEP